MDTIYELMKEVLEKRKVLANRDTGSIQINNEIPEKYRVINMVFLSLYRKGIVFSFKEQSFNFNENEYTLGCEVVRQSSEKNENTVHFYILNPKESSDDERGVGYIKRALFKISISPDSKVILSYFKHPKIIKFSRYFDLKTEKEFYFAKEVGALKSGRESIGITYINQKPVYIYQQYEQGSCSLYHYFIEGKIKLPYIDLLDLLLKITQCLKNNIHSKGIVHLDIKPENIVLKINNDLVESVAIIDMGAARYSKKKCDEDQSIRIDTSVFSTRYYSAPELFPSQTKFGNTTASCSAVLPKHLDYPLDVFSLGATFFVLMTKKFIGKNEKTNQSVLNKKLIKVPDNQKNKLIDLVLAMTKKNPKDRPSMMMIEEILIEIIESLNRLNNIADSVSVKNSEESILNLTANPLSQKEDSVVHSSPKIDDLHPENNSQGSSLAENSFTLYSPTQARHESLKSKAKGILNRFSVSRKPI